MLPLQLVTTTFGKQAQACLQLKDRKPHQYQTVHHLLQSRPNPMDTIVQILSNRDGNRDPRRGLHFQSSLVESSSEGEDDNENVPDHDLQAGNSQVPCGSCCKEQQLENEALRKRIQKLHRGLNIACKSPESQYLCSVHIYCTLFVLPNQPKDKI